MEWSRPDSIPYPNIWKRFNGRKEINGKQPKFWIQDITEDLVPRIGEAMMTGFIMEEPICKYSKMAEDEVSVSEIRELQKYVLTNKLSIACVTNDSEGNPKLAGFSCLGRISKHSASNIKFSGKRLKMLRDLLDCVYSVKDPFNHFNVDEYIQDKGIYVLPEFRGQGICGEFLNAWVSVCKAVGMKVVIGSFTSIVSQNVADRVGFKELSSYDYAALEKVSSEFTLPGIQQHTRSLRLLYQVV